MKKNIQEVGKILAIILVAIGLIFVSDKAFRKLGIFVDKETKLKIMTPYGDDNAYHPKVIAFDEKWNGYKYWIAYTPYTHANSDLENPCIGASNDLVNWEAPKGIRNPLDIPDKVDKIHYNSDTHLLYNPDTNKLEIFWRYVDDEKDELTIYKSTSSDGVHWSEKEIFLFSESRKKQDYLSPAIEYENGTYKIWYVQGRQVHYIEKTNDKLSKDKTLKIDYDEKVYSWHIDVTENNGKYEMVMVSYYDINNRKEMELYYTESTDNENWSTPIKILSPSKKDKAWDSQGLYRASILYENNKYYIFYSAHDEYYNVGIGLMCGDKVTNLKNCNN